MSKFLITLFLGWAGVHKFMEKKTGMGILYLCTLGLFGIGWTIDIFRSAISLLKQKNKYPLNTSNRTPISLEPKLTGVSNCKSISAVKNLNKRTLYGLQQLVFPDSLVGAFTSEQILSACDSIISQTEHIINDCKELINSTENPSVFYERYDLLIEKYQELSNYEPFVVIYGYQPIESLAYFREARSKYEKKFITRCYNKALVKADSMKTEKGRKNQFVKMYELLLQYESDMSPENLSFLHQKFSSKIN